MDHGSAQAPDRRIGMTIGDYVITKKLAEGGMGAVYIAENKPTGLKQIVKFMLAEFVSNPALRERFEREIRAAVRLKGKTNIVEIYSCNERDGEMYMTMEYLQGETLEDHLRRCGKISVHHAFRLVAQIIAALHELHEAGIIHRDLKPANIFVVPTDAEAYCVKLIDFGIIHDRQAIAAGAQQTQHGALVGTPGYMALEQYGNAGNVTPAADVFALAVIIWEMFTGQLPWSAPNEFALYEKTKGEMPVLPHGNHLPNAWQAILFQALRPVPDERPPLHALLYALAREVPAEPPLPSGFDMVTRYAPKVLRNTPVEVETVRASDAQRGAVAYWAIHRATAVPQTGPHAPVSASDSIPISASGFVSSSASMPTVNARPAIPTPSTPIAAPHTTLSAASGVSEVPSASLPSVRRRTWIAAVVAGVGAVALLVLAISMGLSRRAPQAATEPAHVQNASGGSDLASSPAADAAVAPVAVTVDAASLPSAPADAGLLASPVDAGATKQAAEAPARTIKKTTRTTTKTIPKGAAAPPKQTLPSDDPDAPAE